MWHGRLLIVLVLSLAFLPGRIQAHCDGLDGPVVGAARAALERGDVNLVLVWVLEEHEPEVRAAFERTLSVRELGAEAGDLADLYFFETVVRLHRLGEGAPYTGLKLAGRDLGPAIPAADAALETGDLRPLLTLLEGELRRGLSERFAQVREATDYAASDVEAGRRFVASYVTFIHYVERAHESVRAAAHGHYPEPDS